MEASSIEYDDRTGKESSSEAEEITAVCGFAEKL
jgi:hypothetical protein